MFLLTFLSVFVGPQILDGYNDRLSAFPGDSVQVYFNATYEAQGHLIHLYDLRGKVVYSIVMDVFPQDMPRGKAYENGFDYKPTATVVIPDIASGVYLWENVVPIIVKSRKPDIVVVYPSNTANAYGVAGGKSFYDYNSEGRKKAVTLSFLRPVPIQKHAEAFLRWLPRENFGVVGYICDADMDDYQEIRRSSLLIIPGHSEYWTRQARQNFDRFVAEGKNAIVLSGNTMWWQVRYNEAKTELICYKSAEDDRIKNTRMKTTRWNDPTLGYPITKSIGVEFPLAGYGLKQDKGWDGFKIIANSPLLENTTIRKGDIVACPSDEYDGVPLLGFNEKGIPVINRMALGFEKIEIVGYDRSTWGGADGVATWIVFKPTKKSGIIINTASTDWCSQRGIGSNPDIAQITRNMIVKLMKKENVFSPDRVRETMPVVVN